MQPITMGRDQTTAETVTSGWNLPDGVRAHIPPRLNKKLNLFATEKRVALAVAILAVFLVSTVAIAFDNHDFAFPQTKCSVCEVKKVYKATSKKALQDSVFLTAAFRGDGECFHPESLSHAVQSPQPLPVLFFSESDRAPPSFS